MSVNLHFLNVGAGDCTIIHFPERTRHDSKKKSERITMIDICHHEDNEHYENVIDYFISNFRDNSRHTKSIFRFICTHPHHDHICGLKKLLDDVRIGIINFWDLEHSFYPGSFDGHPNHKDDWKAYEWIRRDDTPHTVIRTNREDEPRNFWDDDEDRITILSPTSELIKYAHKKDDGSNREKENVEIDEMSYALMIRINSRKIILGGDGRSIKCWDDIYENCKNDIKNCAVLKAPHHGHETGFHEDAVKLMNPEIIIFSNSKIEDQNNGAEKFYKKACPNTMIYKTSDHGNLIVHIPFDDSSDIKIYKS